jgi:phosphatidylglycerophosphatase C
MFTQAGPQMKISTATGTKKLVLFDFDGTITAKDTLAQFIVYYRGLLRYRYGLMMLAPPMALYLLHILPNWKAKQFLLSWFFKGEREDVFDKKCREFSLRVLPGLIRPKAMEIIKHYKAGGATVAVVSASAENWVRPWCDLHGLVCLATRLEVSNHRLTGRIAGKNCHGSEKVCRIKERFALDTFDEIIAYGDTSGDREMLAIAHKQFYRPFRI